MKEIDWRDAATVALCMRACSEDAPFFFKHVLRKVILPDIFDDIKKFETEMKANTSVDWTIVRPQRLSDDKTEGA